MELSMGMSADYEQAVWKNWKNIKYFGFIRFWKDQQMSGWGRKFSGKETIKNNSQNNNFVD